MNIWFGKTSQNLYNINENGKQVFSITQMSKI